MTNNKQEAMLISEALQRQLVKEPKPSQLTLHHREAKFRAIFEHGSIGIASTCLDGTLIEANAIYQEIIGYSLEELQKLKFTDYTHPDDMAVELALTQEILAGKRNSFGLDKRYIHKQGYQVWVNLNLCAVHNQAGKLLFTMAIVKDITKQKQLEERLQLLETAIVTSDDQMTIEEHQHSESSKAYANYEFKKFTGELVTTPKPTQTPKELSLLVEQMPLATIELDLNREVRSWNRAAEQVFGYTKAEAVGNNLLSLIVPEDCVEQVNQSYDHLLTQLSWCEYTHNNLTKDGRVITCQWYNVVQLDHHGTAIGFACVVMDATERQRQEIALQQAVKTAQAASQAKSRFLSSMSHELRTPLNSILGFSQILARDTSLSVEQREYLRIINHSGEYLLNLINDILSISKIEAGQITLNTTEFDLYKLLDGLEEIFQLKAITKGLKLQFQRDLGLPQYISSDQHKLRQILTNLLGNALKFTDVGSVILRVQSNYPKSQTEPVIISAPDKLFSLTFTVEDTGAGIAPEEMGKLFEPFVQTETGLQSMQGTGLGLSICREFVNLMGGEIVVNSTKQGTKSQLDKNLQITIEPDVVGHGSTFTFTIPVGLATPIKAITPSISTNRRVIGLVPPQPSYRILIAEDVAVNRKLLTRVIQPLGFEVREARNGQEAVEIWSSWQPHLIWMDLLMPIMDGYEATRKIKQFPQGQGTVIIALSAGNFEEQQQKSLAAGCDDFMSKPWEENVLFAKMGHHLRLSYIYEEVIELSSLQVMPSVWIDQLHHAAVCLNHQDVVQLIKQIPQDQSSLAHTLTNLVKNFRLDIIADLTKSTAK